MAAVNADSCADAVPVLEALAERAGSLARLISAGAGPYHRAGRTVPLPIGELSRYEEIAQQYRERSNRAMVLESECLRRLGEDERAVALLVDALDRISAERERDLWDRARAQLYEALGVLETPP